MRTRERKVVFDLQTYRVMCHDQFEVFQIYNAVSSPAEQQNSSFDENATARTGAACCFDERSVDVTIDRDLNEKRLQQIGVY
jgi:hypothetical protein